MRLLKKKLNYAKNLVRGFLKNISGQELVISNAYEGYADYTIRGNCGKNLFEYKCAEVVNASVIENVYDEQGNIIGSVLQGNQGTGDGDASWSNGWFKPGENINNPVQLFEGDVITVSCFYQALELDIYKQPIFILLRSREGASISKSQWVGASTLMNGVRLSSSFTISASYSGHHFYPIITLNSGKIKITDIQIEYGNTATEYEPYKAVGEYNEETGKYDIPIIARGKNLFNYNNDNWINASKVSDVYDDRGNKTGIVIQGNQGTGDGNSSWSNGWYRPTLGNTTMWLEVGDVVTVSLEYEFLVVSENYDGKPAIMLREKESNTTYSAVMWSTPSTGKRLLKATYTIGKSGYYYPIITLNSGRVRITNIQIEYGNTATEYERYQEPSGGVLSLAEPLKSGMEIVNPFPIRLGTGTNIIMSDTEIKPFFDIDYYSTEV